MKTRNRKKNINSITRQDNNITHKQKDIELEVINFYRALMGQKELRLEGVNTIVMSSGPQVKLTQMDMLTCPVTDVEIKVDLDGISDDKNPCIYGYGAKFFKAA